MECFCYWNQKEYITRNVFREILSNFSEEPDCKALPISCFSNSLKSSGWMAAIYFFFGHLWVFWVFFTKVRVTLELRRKVSAMETSDAFVYLPSLKKNISLFDGELLFRKHQSINKFLEIRDQNSLDIRSFSAIFHLKYLRLTNCVHNYQTWAANKNYLKEFPYRTVSFKYFLFPFCAVNRITWKTPWTRLNLSSISNQC